MKMPVPTPIYRMVHLDNLATILRRGGMHGTNQVPNDGLPYRTIHNVDIQNARHGHTVPCGPGGTIHDYVPFYFGPRSPMLLQLQTGRVPGFTDKQPSLVYLVSTAQRVVDAGLGWVFSDGHGVARFTRWFERIGDLDKVDWASAYAERWTDTLDDMDRQRKKQAEFLVHWFCPWEVVQEIGVSNYWAKGQVETILRAYPPEKRRPVQIRPEWYYCGGGGA